MSASTIAPQSAAAAYHLSKCMTAQNVGVSTTLPRQPANPNQIPALSAGSPLTSDDDVSASPDTTTNSPYLTAAGAFPLAADHFKQTIKSEDGVFSFDDWLQWEDPLATVISPSPEPDFLEPFKDESSSPDMNRPHALQPSARRDAMLASGSIDPMAVSNISDDFTIKLEDSIRNEPLFQTSALDATAAEPQATPLTHLYSTPLSWDRPQLGLRSGMLTGYPSLTPAEEEKLRNIAMNTAVADDLPPSPVSDSSLETEGRKRKKSIDDDDDYDSDCAAPLKPRRRQAPLKRTAHNMIEKRYRTNLNDKIAALRDSVPSLRAASKKSLSGSAEGDDEDLDGLTPAHKLNKATVLSKATEYIAHLEKRNKTLQRESQVLRSRIEAFEILLMSRTSVRSDRTMPSIPHQPRYSYDN